MHKGIIILVIISIVLASLLAIQVMQDGNNLAVTQLNTRPVGVQNIQPLPVTNTAENSLNTTGLTVNGTALAMLNAESEVFNQIFKKVENSVVQITSAVNEVGPSINGNPFEGQQRARLG